MTRSLLALLLIVLTSPGALADVKPVVLRAGAAAVDITPVRFPFNMPGGFAEALAEKVHDPFHARALVLDDGSTALALVVVDNLGVAAEVVEEAKKLASRRCGLAEDRIVISSTHTHSGPPSNVKKGREAEVAYRPQLVEGIADAIVRAYAARRPASVGAASHPVPDEVFNRRWYLKPGKMPPNPFGLYDTVKMNPANNPDTLDRPAGPTDPDVSVLSVREPAGKPIALYANYSLHYVGGIPKGVASADYYGEFARLLPSRIKGAGDDFVAIMSNGTSGNINNIPFGVVRPPREPFEQMRIVAQKTADAAWFAVGKIDAHRTNVRLGMLQRQITLKTRRPTPEQVAKAKVVLATIEKSELAKLPPLADVYAKRTLAQLDLPDTITVPLQAIRVGDLAICAVPFETFVETGLDLKKRSPFPRTMVVGIANGYNGYLPTPEQHALGGYESWLGTNRVQVETSVILTENLLEMLSELRKD